jgi:hypothetical protein
MLHLMAEKYGILPSVLLEQGSTIDIQIYHVAENIRIRQQNIKDGKDITNTYNQEYLEQQLQNVNKQP